MLTYKVHFIRHGLTRANLEKRYIGKTDLPLCEEGWQALAERKRNCDYPAVQKVYSSPLLRAKQTAEYLFPDNFLETVDNLREFDFGEFEGKTIEELEGNEEFRRWISSPSSAHVPGGESGEELVARATEAVAYIFSQMMEQRLTSVAAVTHGGLIMSLFAQMGLPQRDTVRWQMQDGCGYTALLSTQMWMRDKKFEIYEQIPYNVENMAE